MSKTVLVIAAHPDDEVLGCGGTMARHVDAGDAVHVCILAQGLASRGEASSAAFEQLRDDARRANAALGVASVWFGDFPDNQMDTVPLLSVIKEIESHIARLQPDIVYTHWCGDVNVDHRVVHEAVVCACRPLPGHSVERLLYFEVASSTEWQTPDSAPAFKPNWFTDISDNVDRKLIALAHYDSEMRDWPHPRSFRAVEHLARWRGATIGAEAAEAFVLGRQISRQK